MRRPWTFARRIALGFAVSLAVALAIAAISTLALRSVLIGDEHLTVDQALNVVKVERLRRFFSEKLAAQRGYALTGNSFFRVESDVARSLFLEALAEMRSHAVDAEEVRLLDRVAADEAEHQGFGQRMMEAREQGAPREELEAFLLRMNAARGQVNAALDRLGWLMEHRLRRGALQAEQSTRRALWLILAAATLGFLGAMGLAWVLTRALRPLHHEAQATEERFRLLVEGVKDYALYLLDPEGRVASWNPGAERIQGWRAEEIIGRPGALLHPPEALAEERPRRELERAGREGRLESEGWRLRKDGSRFWAESLLTALRDEGGRCKGYAVLTRDITERNRLQRAQRLFAEAEHLFHAEKDPDQAVAEMARLLVPELADGCFLFLLTSTGELEPRAVAHVSKEKEALQWRLARHRSMSQSRTHSVWQVLRTGQSRLISEVTPELMMQEAASVDPEQRALIQGLGAHSALIIPLRVAGRTLGVLILFSERPERRFTETDQVFIEELAGRAALALENARLLREAQAALELIGVAAHDLGNPLNALQLMLGKLRRTPPAEPEKLREALTSAVRHTQRLGRLLHNLLDLSRLSSGKLELEVGEVDLGEVVHDAVERHAEQASEAGSRLELKVEQGVVGRWDRLRLERVLTNLLSNAFKYGKGRPIEVRVERAEGHGRLVVRDHGPGIPPEEQPYIFERFKKAVTSGPKKEGFGLGLYIVRQLVEAHGGTVHVESTLGEGAVFTVELPLEPVGREAEATGTGHPPGVLH